MAFGDSLLEFIDTLERKQAGDLLKDRSLQKENTQSSRQTSSPIARLKTALH